MLCIDSDKLSAGTYYFASSQTKPSWKYITHKFTQTYETERVLSIGIHILFFGNNSCVFATERQRERDFGCQCKCRKVVYFLASTFCVWLARIVWGKSHSDCERNKFVFSISWVSSTYTYINNTPFDHFGCLMSSRFGARYKQPRGVNPVLNSETDSNPNAIINVKKNLKIKI